MQNKKFLKLAEAARFIGVTKNYMYKLTHTKKIIHYKPSGKLCVFKVSDLEAFLQKNRIGEKESKKN
jgi:excisionase family DNA binding protein